MTFFYKLNLTLILIFFVCLPSLSQGTQKDIVFLKNGSIVKGKILGFDSLERLEVQSYNGYIYQFSKADIRKFKVKGIKKDYLKSENVKVDEVPRKGFINLTQLGLLVGEGKLSNNWPGNSFKRVFSALSMETYNGYRFSHHYSLGLVTGIDFYEEGALFPVALGTRISILKKRVSPVIFLSCGKGFSLFPKIDDNREFNGGLHWHSGVGLRIKSFGNSAFAINIGYKSQQSTLRISQGSWQGTENLTIQERTYRRISLMLGFSF